PAPPSYPPANYLTFPNELARKNPSPPFRGEREGPNAKRWEGEVGIRKRSGIPHLTPTLSAPEGGEGENVRCRLMPSSGCSPIRQSSSSRSSPMLSAIRNSCRGASVPAYASAAGT